MDIPDLPQGAFEHCGDGKIKPQGGGGGIVSAITDPISDVLGTSGDGGGILGVVEDVGQAVGDVGESFDKAVTQPIGQGLAEVDTFVNREIPGGWALPAAIATYYAAPYAAPYIMGEAAAATTAAEAAAALEAAAAAEGATTAGMVAAANTGLPAGTATLASLAAEATPAVADALATATAEAATALPYSEAFDAVNLAKQGLSEAQIAQTLNMSAGVDQFLATDMARLAAQGLSPDQIVQTLSYSYSPSELSGLNIESKALGLPSKGLTAGQALQGLRLASGLLGQRQQQPQMQQPQLQMPQVRPAGAVDYTGLLNLLSPRTARRNPNSLLG
jgi:DNA-binding CsgD family transcriptional regulator